MGAGAGAGGGPDGVVALGSGGGLLATGGGGGVLPAAGRGEGVPETGAPQLRQKLDAGFNSAPQRAQTGWGGGVSPSMRFPQLSQKSSPSVMGSPQYLQNFGMGVFSSLSGPFRLRGRDAVHGLSVSCRECFRSWFHWCSLQNPWPLFGLRDWWGEPVPLSMRLAGDGSPHQGGEHGMGPNLPEYRPCCFGNRCKIPEGPWLLLPTGRRCA